PLLLDVTTEQEWREKRIGESANIPLTRLGRQIEELPRDRPIGVHCSSGYRAAIAASLPARRWFQAELRPSRRGVRLGVIAARDGSSRASLKRLRTILAAPARDRGT